VLASRQRAKIFPVVLRIWTLLVAVMLLASPAQAMTGAEAPAESELCAEDLATQIATDLPAATPARVVIVRTGVPMPPSPALSRVFRPPRPPVD
jgi:hypothetical protein